MPCDEYDAIARQFVGDRNRLIGVAEVIAHHELDRLTENATAGVEILHCQLGGAQLLLAEPSDRAGHRARRRKPDLRRRRGSAEVDTPPGFVDASRASMRDNAGERS